MVDCEKPITRINAGRVLETHGKTLSAEEEIDGISMCSGLKCVDIWSVTTQWLKSGSLVTCTVLTEARNCCVGHILRIRYLVIRHCSLTMSVVLEVLLPLCSASKQTL